MDKPVARVIDLVPPESQRPWNLGTSEARRRLLGADPAGVLEIEGSWALWAQDGERVCLARSLDRPLRYFLAKDASGSTRSSRRSPPRAGRDSSTRPTRGWSPRTT